MPQNPCVTCGACCAFYRVSFYWLEADPSSENPVPYELTEDFPPYHLCMKGTNQKYPRCVALAGQIGERVTCSIYENRPSPCRDFGIHFEGGHLSIDPGDLERCNHARAVWHSPPIDLDDYREGSEIIPLPA